MLSKKKHWVNQSATSRTPFTRYIHYVYMNVFLVLFVNLLSGSVRQTELVGWVPVSVECIAHSPVSNDTAASRPNNSYC